MGTQETKTTDEITHIDLSNDPARRVVVAQGTQDVYQGHPTTLLLPDGKTIIAVWTINHGGPCGPMAKSPDGGLTWHAVKTPDNWKQIENCPAIYRVPVPGEHRHRLVVYASGNVPTGSPLHIAHSEDEGQTWSPMQRQDIGPIVMPLCTIAALPDGRLLGMTNNRRNGTPRTNVVSQTYSHDGGLTWEPTRVVLDIADKSVCEPCLVWSPDRSQLLVLLRENSHTGPSLGMTSCDHGKTWSKPFDLPGPLTGDRHMVACCPDGRLVITFRDQCPGSPGYGHFVAWVGTYDDIMNHRPGQYRIKLAHHFGKPGDCGYSGIERLPDGTMVATTYVKYRDGNEKNSVVSIRFRLDELG